MSLRQQKLIQELMAIAINRMAYPRNYSEYCMAFSTLVKDNFDILERENGSNY
jgi:hypothetical protein